MDYVPAHYRVAIFRIYEISIYLLSQENMNMIHGIIDVKCIDIRDGSGLAHEPAYRFNFVGSATHKIKHINGEPTKLSLYVDSWVGPLISLMDIFFLTNV